MLCDNWSYSPCNLDMLDYNWAPREWTAQPSRLFDAELCTRMRLVRRALERTFDYLIRRRKSHNKNSEETRIVLGDKKQIAGVSNRNSI